MKITKKIIEEKIKCNGTCGKLKAASNFYINTNPIFTSQKLEVCKTCITNYIGKKNNDLYLTRVKQVLAIMDKPFIEEIWELSEKEWSKYIPQISSLGQYKGLTFADSKHFSIEVEHDGSIDLGANLSDEAINELQLMWGKGLEWDEYMFLENQYETLLSSYESDSYAQQMLFQEIAHQRLVIKKLRESHKPTDKEIKTLQDLLGSSNIKPVQETGANSSEQATFGTLLKKYENERPVPEPDPAWEDVDGIKKYVQVWFLGHLCRMLGIKNEYSKMYEDEIAKFKVEAPEYEEDQDVIVP